MEGLVLMDAMTAIFLENLEWQKLDVIAFAMQKILGGDGSLGALILSPKALKRLAIAKPWPIPRTFNINEWKLENVVNGTFMSTPSILALIELNSILDWVDQKGGLTFLQTKNAENWAVIEEFLSKYDQFEYTIKNADHRAKAVACIGLTKWQNEHISLQQKMEEMKDIAQKAEKLKVYDICNFYIPSWRFWAGPMQEADDIKIGLERFINIFKSKIAIIA
jgi:phosphoserine aminotransferase